MRPIPWQVRFRRAVARPGVRLAALSVPRSNGKSYLVADIAKEYLLNGHPNTECLVVAADFRQAKIVTRYVTEMLRDEGHDLDDRSRWGHRDSVNHAMIRDKRSGITVRAMPARPAGLHGRVWGLCLIDEPREIAPGTRDDLLSSITSGMGKRPGSRVIGLGTLPEDAGHWFRRWCEGEADYAQVHQARKGDPPFQLRTMKRANPSFDFLPALREDLHARREKVRGNPDLEDEWKSRHLNMGVADAGSVFLLTPEEWQAIEVDELPPRSGPCVWGIDAASSEAFCAVVAYWPLTHRVEGMCALGGVPTLAERARRDHAGRTYLSMVRDGSLLVQEGRRVPSMSRFIGQAIQRFGVPDCIISDHFRRPEVADALDASPMPRGRPLIARRTRYSESTEDIRRARTLLLEQRVKVEKSVSWRQAMSETRVVRDAGNVRLAVRGEAGRRARARTDLVSAMVLALAEADRRGIPASGARPRLVAV